MTILDKISTIRVYALMVLKFLNFLNNNGIKVSQIRDITDEIITVKIIKIKKRIASPINNNPQNLIEKKLEPSKK